MNTNFTKSQKGLPRKCGAVTWNLLLDTRHKKSEGEKLPVAIRFSLGGKHLYYFPFGEKFTEKRFSKICTLNQFSTNATYKADYDKFVEAIDKAKNVVESIDPKSITIELIRSKLGVEQKEEGNDNLSFLGVWDNKIATYIYEGKAGTADRHKSVKKHFIKCLGEIKGFRISKVEIEKWCNAMDNGIKKNGKLIGKVSVTTKAINLSTLRTIWKECNKIGYLKDVEYPFSNVEGSDLIAIPQGRNRKDHYLNVEKWTELYNIFINKRYPLTWSEERVNRVHYGLGLFLFQYLANGLNFVDVALLEYNDFYFNHDRKAFKFIRNKTKRTSGGGSGTEVIIPITEPLQKVLNGLKEMNSKDTTFLAEPKKGQRVFPDILKGTNDPEKIRYKAVEGNHILTYRIRLVFKEILSSEIEPSGTWARHSFATNLRFAGIDEQYISYSMGHSSNKSITDRYIANYSIEQQIANNEKLLNLKKGTNDNFSIDALLGVLTDEQKKELIKKLVS